MGILSKIVDEIKYRVPMPLLEATYNNYNTEGWRRAPVSIDELILSKTIRPRVIVDTDIVGGQTIIVPLEGGSTVEYADAYSRVIHVGAEALGNRTIVGVMSAYYMPYAIGNSLGGTAVSTQGYSSSNDLTNAASRVNNAISSVPILSTASVQLIGHNTVLVQDRAYISNIYSLRCMVTNEENLENINPRSWHIMSKLSELAVKSYIYNTLIIQAGNVWLKGGQELGIFSEILNSYSDSEQMYQEYLREIVQKTIGMMNNSVEYAKYIRMQISPGL